jgi:hypothetical protein
MALSTADGDGWFAFGRITLAQKKRSRRWSPLTVHVRLFAQRGRATAPSAKPAAANAKDEKAPVSVSGMTAPEYAQCVSDLTSSHVVFQQARRDRAGCKISSAIRLKAVTTAVGSVSMTGEPAMLCSFAPEFTG